MVDVSTNPVYRKYLEYKSQNSTPSSADSDPMQEKKTTYPTSGIIQQAKEVDALQKTNDALQRQISYAEQQKTLERQRIEMQLKRTASESELRAKSQRYNALDTQQQRLQQTIERNTVTINDKKIRIAGGSDPVTDTQRAISTISNANPMESKNMFNKTAQLSAMSPKDRAIATGRGDTLMNPDLFKANISGTLNADNINQYKNNNYVNRSPVSNITTKGSQTTYKYQGKEYTTRQDAIDAKTKFNNYAKSYDDAVRADPLAYKKDPAAFKAKFDSNYNKSPTVVANSSPVSTSNKYSVDKNTTIRESQFGVVDESNQPIPTTTLSGLGSFYQTAYAEESQQSPKQPNMSFRAGSAVKPDGEDYKRSSVNISVNRVPINPNSDEGKTIQSIYDRQTETWAINQAQKEYFWALTRGEVPVGKALFDPETTQSYVNKTTGVATPESPKEAQRVELTKRYLEERGMSLDTPLAMAKLSPTRYTEAREFARDNPTGEMGDLTRFVPNSLFQKPAVTPYLVDPKERAQQLLDYANSSFRVSYADGVKPVTGTIFQTVKSQQVAPEPSTFTPEKQNSIGPNLLPIANAETVSVTPKEKKSEPSPQATIGVPQKEEINLSAMTYSQLVDLGYTAPPKSPFDFFRYAVDVAEKPIVNLVQTVPVMVNNGLLTKFGAKPMPEPKISGTISERVTDAVINSALGKGTPQENFGDVAKFVESNPLGYGRILAEVPGEVALWITGGKATKAIEESRYVAPILARAGNLLSTTKQVIAEQGLRVGIKNIAVQTPEIFTDTSVTKIVKNVIKQADLTEMVPQKVYTTMATEGVKVAGEKAKTAIKTLTSNISSMRATGAPTSAIIKSTITTTGELVKQVANRQIMMDSIRVLSNPRSFTKFSYNTVNKVPMISLPRLSTKAQTVYNVLTRKSYSTAGSIIERISKNTYLVNINKETETGLGYMFVDMAKKRISFIPSQFIEKQGPNYRVFQNSEWIKLSEAHIADVYQIPFKAFTESESGAKELMMALRQFAKKSTGLPTDKKTRSYLTSLKTKSGDPYLTIKNLYGNSLGSMRNLSATSNQIDTIAEVVDKATGKIKQIYTPFTEQVQTKGKSAVGQVEETKYYDVWFNRPPSNKELSKMEKMIRDSIAKTNSDWNGRIEMNVNLAWATTKKGIKAGLKRADYLEKIGDVEQASKLRSALGKVSAQSIPITRYPWQFTEVNPKSIFLITSEKKLPNDIMSQLGNFAKTVSPINEDEYRFYIQTSNDMKEIAKFYKGGKDAIAKIDKRQSSGRSLTLEEKLIKQFPDIKFYEFKINPRYTFLEEVDRLPRPDSKINDSRKALESGSKSIDGKPNDSSGGSGTSGSSSNPFDGGNIPNKGSNNNITQLATPSDGGDKIKGVTKEVLDTVTVEIVKAEKTPSLQKFNIPLWTTMNFGITFAGPKSNNMPTLKQSQKTIQPVKQSQMLTLPSIKQIQKSLQITVPKFQTTVTPKLGVNQIIDEGIKQMTSPMFKTSLGLTASQSQPTITKLIQTPINDQIIKERQILTPKIDTSLTQDIYNRVPTMYSPPRVPPNTQPPLSPPFRPPIPFMWPPWGDQYGKRKSRKSKNKSKKIYWDVPSWWGGAYNPREYTVVTGNKIPKWAFGSVD